MERCRRAKAYWSLLHVTVCLPDICAALESDNGRATVALYEAWCDKYVLSPALSGAERYDMRCKLLHQGQARTGKTRRYTDFVFGQPSSGGTTDHMRAEGTTLHVDVGELAQETRNGVGAWIERLEANPAAAQAANVEANLQSLVQVREVFVPASTGQLTVGEVTINATRSLPST